jgi:hypothetical protein
MTMRASTSQYDPETLARLQKLETLAARPGTPGEGAAARAAIDRIQARCGVSQQPAFDFQTSQQRRPGPPDILLGMNLRLDRGCDRRKACCRGMGVIGPGKGPHAFSLRCVDCGRQRGWLRQSAADLLRAMAADGRLKSPILRDRGVVP